MTPSYQPYEPRQQQLLPCALQEWLPEGHLAYYINDVVDSLDLSAFHARYMGGGPRNQPFHPVKAQAEWKLVCAALNLRRMATMMAT